MTVMFTMLVKFLLYLIALDFLATCQEYVEVTLLDNQQHQKVYLLVNDTRIYINIPPQTESRSNSEPNKQADGGNTPLRGFELTTSGFDTVLITNNTKRLT